MWTGEGWQMQPLKEVEAAVRQARELEEERSRALAAQAEAVKRAHTEQVGR